MNNAVKYKKTCFVKIRSIKKQAHLQFHKLEAARKSHFIYQEMHSYLHNLSITTKHHKKHRNTTTMQHVKITQLYFSSTYSGFSLGMFVILL